MSGLAPRALGDSVRPRRSSRVVVRPLNFTVRGRKQIRPMKRKQQGRRAQAKTLRLRLRERARSVCKVLGDFLGFSCVCRRCGCG